MARIKHHIAGISQADPTEHLQLGAFSLVSSEQKTMVHEVERMWYNTPLPSLVFIKFGQNFRTNF